MRSARIRILLTVLIATAATAQDAHIDPQIRSRDTADQKVTAIELSPHFVTTIRLPEPVSAVVIGDPGVFQVEHSEQEPKLIFVKPLSMEDAESNLLISTAAGRQISVLLISHAHSVAHRRVDFLLRYQPRQGFLVDRASMPFAIVSQTTEVSSLSTSGADPTLRAITPSNRLLPRAPAAPKADALDQLLERQMRAPLPTMGSQQVTSKGRSEIRAGISEVHDDDQQVIVLFSIINSSNHPVLLMPPQIQLRGRHSSGRLIKQEHWTTGEQLAVVAFRLSLRRIGPGGRADGVLIFERPPYKRSNEILFLQIGESGAIDKPTLVPIGFGVSTSQEGVKNAQ